MVPAAKVIGTWKSAFEKDPFDVGIDDKIQFLLKLNERALKTNGVSFVNSSMGFANEQKFYASTDGSRIDQYIIRTNPNFNVTAVNRANGDFQSRNSLAGPQGMGYEYMEKYPWLNEVEQAGEDAVAKLKARPIEPGKYDLVLHPSHLWLTVHESVGHPTELDRSLWWEADYAGTTFLTRDKLGKLQFASKIMNFVADRTQPVGLATVGYDDEGVPAQCTPIISNGLFTGYLSSRETAHTIGENRSGGTMRAEGWSRLPMIRMTNISLLPGTKPLNLEQLIADTDRGVLMQTNRSWSIDDKRYNFQFGCEIGWEIKNGKRVRMVKNPSYSGITTEFWNSLDAICSREQWTLWGTPNCGKGQPQQVMGTGHGAAPSRFRGIKVGSAYKGN